MIEFTNILLRSTLPLHPYLTEHPCLSLRLIADGDFCGETASVNGDLATGTWEINSSICADTVKDSVTLAVVATLAIADSSTRHQDQCVSVTLSVADLLERVKAHPDATQEFNIVDPHSSIQFLMTCLVKVSPSSIMDNSPSQVFVDRDDSAEIKGGEPQLYSQLKHSKRPSRDDLEFSYTEAICTQDEDKKAHRLNLLGSKYHALYKTTSELADLERAISMHEEGMQCTRSFRPQLAKHVYSFAVVLEKRFDRGGALVDIERAISHYEMALALTEDGDAQKPRRFRSLGTALESRFERLDSLADLEDAISHFRTAVELTPDGHLAKAPRLNNLGKALESRFERLDSLADLEDVISNFRTAVELTPDGHHNKAPRLNNLGQALESRFERLDSLADLEDAISNFQTAVELTPDGHLSEASRLNSLVNALQSRFERLGGLADLEDAILYHRKAVELTPDGHHNKAPLLNNLGQALESRFERLDSLADLEDAVSNFQTAVELTPDGHLSEASRLNSLGNALQSRFERLGGLADLEDAILYHRKAVELTPDGHHNKAPRLNSLGYALQSRFERLGGLEDLEDAISYHQKAVEQAPDGHPDKASQFNHLGCALQSRFERLGNLADLEDAISYKRKALELTPDGHPKKADDMSSLGFALKFRFERLGNLADLEDAISYQQKAVELQLDDPLSKAIRFSNLGNMIVSRFERLGGLADLEDAISYHRKAVELAPDGYPDKASPLNNLASTLQFRFEQLGSLADLEDAISYQRKALELMPDGHTHKATLLDNLARALQSRFDWLGSLADLEDAILNRRRVVELTPDGHPRKANDLNSLGVTLQSRFERLGKLADLEDAISSQRKALELTPDDHPGKASRLNNLGMALQYRYSRLGSFADLEDAISYQRKAVELMPEGYPGKASQLNNLVSTLQLLFKRVGSLADLEDAISYQRKVVEVTPDGHPGKVARLARLGTALQSRFERLGSLSDLEGALYALSTATTSTSGPAMDRFNAARLWVKAAEKHSRSPLDAFGSALNLLPQIAWLALAVTDQHALLADVGDIVRDAVAAAIKYEEYETAVIWAEQGRSIVWQNLLGLRSPVDFLRETRPDLADRLLTIAQQLEGSESHAEMPTASAGDVSRNHSKLAIDWDNLINEIRSIPNFEGFLRAKDFSQLAAAAHEGPVVILNISKSQCDALVLISDDSDEKHVSVVNIPLESFSYKKCKTMFQGLKKLLSSAGLHERNDRKTGRHPSLVDDETKFQMILGTLWRDVVKPVIEGLALQTQSERPPRIWWCTTGLLSFLPIHAAGLYDTQEIGEKISDYVVSSYTPTITAILDPSNPVMQGDFQVLTVAQPSAPGAPPIPKTEDEVQIIHSLINGASVLNLTKENATMQRVQEGMMESNWIHLACHGQQNPDDPMKSGFLLHDGILKLSQIVTMKLPKTEFAFLSACQTAMGDEKVADESVHLAAAMFLSGCRGVIATTWSIRDDDAPRVAEVVYSRMFKDAKSNRKEAAYALHDAVKLLRDSGAKFTSWVPFIHLGR